MFSCSYINYLPEHEYEIINSTDKAYSLVISNPKYGAGTFSIPGDTTTTIKTYENNPAFQLYDGPSLVENHMVKENNKIVIY